MKSLAFLVAGISILAVSANAQVIVDDFNDGNDTGWTRIQPLNAFVPNLATFAFPSGGYQISSGASPNPGALGPARAGAYRGDASYSDFRISVDIVNWTNNPSQVFGSLARVGAPGLGTTNGYALTLSLAGSLDLSRVTGEAATGLATGNIGGPLNLAVDYQLVFTGVGGLLTGSVYDVANPGVALQTVSFTDNTYASGFGGIFVFDSSQLGNQPVSVTFDNYRSSVPEPSAALLGLVALGLLVRRRR
jgi:MYXO-CTERM domain-containing protein